MNYITYLRVSTDEQKRSGLGIEAQRSLVMNHINAQKGYFIAEFIDYESGRKLDSFTRPNLFTALKVLKCTPNCKLLLAKTDRIARDLHFISGLIKQGVPLVVAGHEQMSKLEWHMHAMIAEHEAELISQRTKEALAQAKSRGVLLGAPRHKIKKISMQGGKANAAKAQEHRRKIREVLEHLVDAHRHASGFPDYEIIARKLNELSITTYRGLPFTKGTAYYVIKKENLDHDKKY